jgi:hypothetical protein
LLKQTLAAMKKLIAAITTILIFNCQSVLFADKLPKIAYFNIPKGRSIQSQKAINSIGYTNGVVAVHFVMDKKGNVLSANVDAKNTTVKDKAFVKKVVDAVLAVRFNKIKNGPEKQSGSLAYVFN